MCVCVWNGEMWNVERAKSGMGNEMGMGVLLFRLSLSSTLPQQVNGNTRHKLLRKSAASIKSANKLGHKSN